MEPTQEQSYLRRIADLEKQNGELRAENAELRAQVARLTEQVAKLTEQVARLSKNSSNSSKPPSSDIVKPPRPGNTKGPRRQGGQHGHPGASRPPFRPDQIEHVEPLRPPACPNGHQGTLEPVGQPRIHQVAAPRPSVSSASPSRAGPDRVLRQAAGCAEGEPSKSRTLARRVVKHGEAIFRFLFDAAVEPTNNAAERGPR